MCGCMSVLPALGKWRQQDQEFKASLNSVQIRCQLRLQEMPPQLPVHTHQSTHTHMLACIHAHTFSLTQKSSVILWTFLEDIGIERELVGGWSWQVHVADGKEMNGRNILCPCLHETPQFVQLIYMDKSDKRAGIAVPNCDCFLFCLLNHFCQFGRRVMKGCVRSIYMSFVFQIA